MSVVADLIDAFERYERRAGVRGVAFGHKAPADRTAPPAVAFVVEKKLPRKGSRRTLENGCTLLPKTTKFGKGRILADVIQARTPKAVSAVEKQAGAVFPAGCQMSNRTASGTMGALVRRDDSPQVYALTNRHVAIGVGNFVFVPTPTPGAIGARVSFDLDVLDDRQVLPFLTSSNAYVDVDAALAAIPEARLQLFSPVIPELGRPTSIFEPDYSSVDAYRDSVVGTEVSAYSWNSQRRDGVISHVLYATRPRTNGTILLYTFLVQGTGNAPGVPRDSGKVWVRQGQTEGEVELVGLHQGVIPVAQGAPQYALVTDFYAIARLLRLGLA